MLVVNFILVLLSCGVALGDKVGNAATDMVNDAKRTDLEVLMVRLEELESRIREKFEERLQTIDGKLEQLNERIGAMNSKMEQIQVSCRAGGDVNGSSLTVATLQEQAHNIHQQTQDELRKLSNQIGNSSAAGEKLTDHLERTIQEQFRMTSSDKRQSLLSALQSPGKEFDNGWTVFHRRFDGSVNFYRNWTEYQQGFGDRMGEFWLGLDQLSEMLATARHELLVLLEAFDGEIAYAHYDDFRVGDETLEYMLESVGRYTGSAGDSFSDNVEQRFSTFDQDNDAYEELNCAEELHGAWWYGYYSRSNLNSLYNDGKSYYIMDWRSFKNNDALKAAKMMVRPYSPLNLW